MEYTVTWTIQVDADTPTEAAVEAERYQLIQIEHKDDAQRGVFDVTGEDGVTHTVDLDMVKSSD